MQTLLKRVNKSSIAYGLTCIFVIIWTLLRFLKRPAIYDLVTQQLVAREWVHGNFNPIVLGKTHYLFKTIFLYMPLEILPGSPKLKLILLTLVINILTFTLIAILVKKILLEFRINTDNVSLAMLWLSLIAGSVFWISFANSRNLELAGGMYLMYLVLLVLKRPRIKLVIWLAVFSGMLFFADTLQIYMTAMPLLIYSIIINRKRTFLIAASLLAGVLVSKSLFWVASHYLHITFDGGAAAFGQIDVLSAIKSTIILFAGSTDAGVIRVVVNIVTAASIPALFLYAYKHNKIPKQFALLLSIYVIVNELIYIFSGQAHQSQTSRYLIMLAPIMLLSLAATARLIPIRFCKIYVVLAVGINLSMLSLSLHRNWGYGKISDSHINSVARYLNSHNQPYAFASMDTALPISYFRSAKQVKMFALACAEPRLVMAKSVPVPKYLDQTSLLAPIIFDSNNAVYNSPAMCTVGNVITQLGRPSLIAKTDDNSVVLVYPATVLQSL